MDYQSFLNEKLTTYRESGFLVNHDEINPLLFDWQRELTRLSLYRGRSAIFADCGLGKTPMQLEWSKHVSTRMSSPVLILAPLAVSHQTRREGTKFGIPVTICKDGDDVRDGVNITNYERLEKFDPSVFSGVVLDESSILKNFSGKIRNQIIDLFSTTQYKLCCTATPSPNDYTELGNTAEFLGVMTRAEMLSMFFINDSGDTTASWRLKGHVKDNFFWKWLASWSVVIRKPSDIGFSDDGFDLPKLNIIDVTIPFEGPRDTLFVEMANTLSDRRNARRSSLPQRVAAAAELVNNSDETWMVWCDLNDESASLANAIGQSVEVKGSDSSEFKEISMMSFADGNIKCLVSKPSIAALGMNFQSCHNTIFVGLSDSFEQYYQAVRRFWRFGQKHEVNAYIITGEREGRVVDNIKRKESDMRAMFDSMAVHMSGLMKNELAHTGKKSTPYAPSISMRLPHFLEEN